MGHPWHIDAGKGAGTTRVKRLQRPTTFPEFQEMFEYIYGEKNRRDYKDDGELVRRLMEEISFLGKIARKDEPQKIPQRVADTFAWTVALANRKKINLHEALCFKFPGICTYCLKEKACVCGLEHPDCDEKEKEILLRRLRRERVNMPQTLEEHFLWHVGMYGPQNRRILLIQIVSHLSEEAGEVSFAERFDQRKELMDEMADICSQLFAIVGRLQLGPFSDLIWKAYSYECVTCHEEICTCKEKR